jgi:ADP-ribose pyrophosphatase
MKAWEKLSEDTQKVGFKTVVIKKFRLPDGVEADYTTWNKPGEICVATIALTPDHKIVVARQFRTGPEVICDELPGGGLDEGEELAEAALRELKEETGYVPDDPIRLIGTTTKDAYTNNVHYYFIATNCRKTAEQELDSTEHIEIHLITIEEMIKNSRTARISDSAAIGMAYEELMQLKEKI